MADSVYQFTVIRYVIDYDGIFLTHKTRERLREALESRAEKPPKGGGTIQIDYKGRLDGKKMMKTIVLDKIRTIDW